MPMEESEQVTAAMERDGRAVPDAETIKQHIEDILEPSRRDGALAELSRCREAVPDLAVQLWNSFGVVAVLLQEVIGIYKLLSPPALTSAASTRVCNALALMQCLASHERTRPALLQAQIPLYLYPCLSTSSKARPFEYLRLTCLGVIGALVKQEDRLVIEFLLSTEIIPLCLRIMETGNELSRTVAIFIIQKILLDPSGLDYICQTYERFFAVVAVLDGMVAQLVEQPSIRLLKHVIRCYLRLSEHKRALEGLRQHGLPAALRDGTFEEILRGGDPMTEKFMAELLSRLAQPPIDQLI